MKYIIIYLHNVISITLINIKFDLITSIVRIYLFIPKKEREKEKDRRYEREKSLLLVKSVRIISLYFEYSMNILTRSNLVERNPCKSVQTRHRKTRSQINDLARS